MLIALWLMVNAMLGLPIIGIAIYLKAKDFRSKKVGSDGASGQMSEPVPTSALELNEAA